MPLPASFGDFTGSRDAVENLRAAIAAGRLPHSLVLAGPQGVGKYTLALLLTMALDCEREPREQAAGGRMLAGFCGQCRHCLRIAESADLDTRVAEAVAAREEIPRETDKRETRILIQTHPDVLILPPDPPQLLIKLGQVRTMIDRAQRLPAEARARVFILSSAAMMKEAANSLLKILEEPPPHVHILLLAENVSELLPTIRSRCAIVRLGALPPDQIQQVLGERRPELSANHLPLIARLSEGAVGRALTFPLDEYLKARSEGLQLLSTAQGESDFAALFRVTETYRAGAEGQARLTVLLRALARLLEDVLLIQSGSPGRVANIDQRRELERFAGQLTFPWIEDALHALDNVQSGMRRNLLRSLGLDALAAELQQGGR